MPRKAHIYKYFMQRKIFQVIKYSFYPFPYAVKSFFNVFHFHNIVEKHFSLGRKNFSKCTRNIFRLCRKNIFHGVTKNSLCTKIFHSVKKCFSL